MTKKTEEQKRAKELAKKKAKATKKAFNDDSDDETYGARIGCMSDSGSSCLNKPKKPSSSGYHSDAVSSSSRNTSKNKEEEKPKLMQKPPKQLAVDISNNTAVESASFPSVRKQQSNRN